MTEARHRIATLELPLKGDREYIHSTDIVPAVLSIARVLTSAPDVYIERMSFRHLLATSSRVHLCEVREDRTAPVTFRMAGSGARAGSAWGHLEPTMDPPLTRVPYPEDVLSRSMVKHDNFLTMPTVVGFSELEHAVALGKWACLEMLGRGRWLVISLDFLIPLGQAAYGGKLAGRSVYRAQIKAGPGRDRATVKISSDGTDALRIRFLRVAQ